MAQDVDRPSSSGLGRRLRAWFTSEASFFAAKITLYSALTIWAIDPAQEWHGVAIAGGMIASGLAGIGFMARVYGSEHSDEGQA